MSLEKKLFSENAPKVQNHWKFWATLSSLAGFAFIIFFTTSFNSSTLVVLADAIDNTFQLTSSDTLVKQEITLVNGNISDKETYWLYQDNVRTESVYSTDGVMTDRTATLVSSDEGIFCHVYSLSEEPICEATNKVPFEPFKNDGTLKVYNVSVEPKVTLSEEGNIFGDTVLSWETDVPMTYYDTTIPLDYPQQAGPSIDDTNVLFSTGPSGYVSNGHFIQGKPELTADGKFRYSFLLHAEHELRPNASRAYYPDLDGKFDIQIADETGKSLVYLLDLDTYTVVPLSDADLEASREEYQKRMGAFEVSTERMEQDYDLMFSNVRYLQGHASELDLLQKDDSDPEVVEYTYSVPQDLLMTAGVNNSQVSEASFTLDLNTQKIIEFSLYDVEGEELQHTIIVQTSLTVDPSTIFNKEVWLDSL